MKGDPETENGVAPTDEADINLGAGLAAEAINAAEEVADPLDGLLEKCLEDPGAAFRPEVIMRLDDWKKEDKPAFETFRFKLRKAGVRVTEMDKCLTPSKVREREPSQADRLVDLSQTAEFFHTADKTAFADLDINGHRETWPIRAKGFRLWLAQRFHEETDGAPSSEALQSALNVIEANAWFDGPERVVHVRIGGLADKIYVDLGDDTWQAIEIDAFGWRIISSPPVRFRRASGMLPLPIPVRGGSITALRPFLNVQTDADFVLVVAWALTVLGNRHPYPIMAVYGEAGSAKSTFTYILRALLDPNIAPLRILPREDRDLFIAASNGQVLAFDNVSGLPDWLSDALCQLATGAGFAKRELYTNQDELIIDVARPIILNGIENMVNRSDLADRAIFLTLPQIPEECRRPEEELRAAFENERPLILGALLDGVVDGLKRIPDTCLPMLPRMADFALWGTACETAYWPAGTFYNAYCGNREDIVDDVVEADPIAATVRDLMATRTEQTGTASELLATLTEQAGERAKAKTWPNDASTLSRRLRRSITVLRKVGIVINFDKRGHARTRIIRITAAPVDSVLE